MSHSPERKEKNCLNCNTIVEGRYCQACGQENIEPRETFWHILSHFFNDITHFDGKFFTTLKDVLLKPGFLSKEYVAGKRVSYLHPIRMYVFTSAIFFIIVFSLFNAKELVKGDTDKIKIEELTEAKTNLETEVPKIKDSLIKVAATKSLQRISTELALLQKTEQAKEIKDSISRLDVIKDLDSTSGDENRRLEDSIKKAVANSIKKKCGWNVNTVPIDNIKFTSIKAYDEVQADLPSYKRHGWFSKLFIRSGIHFTKEARENKTEAIRAFMDKFMHSFPQMLFVSLPFFALILQVLYLRGKKFFYADHIIFSIHLYCAAFIFLLVLFGLNALYNKYNWGWLRIPEVGLIIFLFIYLYKAMRTFYEQGRTKTILKFLILEMGSFFMAIVLLVIFLSLSFVRS